MRKIPKRMRRLAVLSGLALVAVAVFAPTASAQSGKLLSIVISPTAHNYGTIDSGTRASKTFVVRNNGLLPTSPLRVRLSGSAAFKKTADSCTGRILWPKDVLFLRKRCSITVRFRPTSAGSTYKGTLTVSLSGFNVSARAALSGKSTVQSKVDCKAHGGTYARGGPFSNSIWTCSGLGVTDRDDSHALFWVLAGDCFDEGGNQFGTTVPPSYPGKVTGWCRADKVGGRPERRPQQSSSP